MQPVPVVDIFGNVRVLLNDKDDQIFHDDDILPLFRMAYDDLRLGIQNYNIPITNATSEQILLPAGSRTLGSEGNPPLPADLVEILSINERPAGSSVDYMLMVRRDFLPLTNVQTAYLGLWSWQNQIVKFLGATGDIDLKINYVADTLGVIVDENSVVTYINSRNYLQYRTAALAASFIGENENRASELNDNAQMTVDLLINQAIKTKQSITTRRRPFESRSRSRGYGW